MASVKKTAVVCECMIELRPKISAAGYLRSTIDEQSAYSGDALNVAVYLVRQDIDVE